jgi:hypothetical protein
MSRAPYLTIPFAAVALTTTCAPRGVSSLAPADCPFVVPVDATRFDRDSLPQLAGEYRLTQITWQPAPPIVTRGNLHLEIPDSATREVPCGFRNIPRDLIGWYRSERASTSVWDSIIGSKDPLRPGVVVQGSELRIGQHCVLDGGGEDLEITALSSQGFWGYWHRDMGIAVLLDTITHRIMPDAAGFFCARRDER